MMRARGGVNDGASGGSRINVNSDMTMAQSIRGQAGFRYEER